MFTNLCSSGVIRYKGGDFLEDVVYELYSCHPAIDFVCYVHSTSGSKYLIFIQLLLSSYVSHKSNFGNMYALVQRKSC